VEIELRRRGVCSRAELGAVLELSQATLSRALSALPTDRLQRIGRGRSTRYACVRHVDGRALAAPLYEIQTDGQPTRVGVLHALEGGSWFLDQETVWPALRGEFFPEGLFPGWPWFLDDLRPQGFLGRLFARQLASEGRFPEEPRLWSAEQVFHGLIRHGVDLPGAWILGGYSLAGARAEPTFPAIPVDGRSQVYLERSQEVLQGAWPGSSAAGEQPKFIARVAAPEGIRHVIVKFSGDRRDPAQARRADLLVAEAIASQVLAEGGVAAPATEILFGEDRCFLESTRFDRIGALGRRHVVSLFALDAAFYGELNTPWSLAARRMARDGFLAPACAERLSVLWWFGQRIGNSDMHYGNASLLLAPVLPLALAPVYDMCPMALHPRADGSLPDRLPPATPPPPEFAGEAAQADLLAQEFFRRAVDDDRLSPSFREIMRQGLR